MNADLPYVRPLKSSHQCRRCARWLEGEWSSADAAGRAELNRQMSVGRCDNCTRREAADLAAAEQTDTGGPEEWPNSLGPLGKVWACQSLPGVIKPVIAVVITSPPGRRQQGAAVLYDAPEFRALVAKMQQLADSLPPDEGIPT